MQNPTTVIDGDEAFEFTWVGKKAATVEANKPIRKTLRPCVEQSVNWDTTQNIFIEGDNLEALKLLQESYLGAVKMIYIVIWSLNHGIQDVHDEALNLLAA